jgi:hypothetical protein
MVEKKEEDTPYGEEEDFPFIIPDFGTCGTDTNPIDEDEGITDDGTKCGSKGDSCDKPSCKKNEPVEETKST